MQKKRAVCRGDKAWGLALALALGSAYRTAARSAQLCELCDSNPDCRTIWRITPASFLLQCTMPHDHPTAKHRCNAARIGQCRWSATRVVPWAVGWVGRVVPAGTKSATRLELELTPNWTWRLALALAMANAQNHPHPLA